MNIHKQFYVALTVSTVILLSILLSLAGCQGRDHLEEDSARIACIELLRKVPNDYRDFQFWDAGALRDSPDLSEMYQVWRERKADYLKQTYGLDISKIDYLAEAGLIFIYKTNYDLESFRQKISADFHRDTDYPDMDVWKSAPAREPQDVTGGWVLTKGFLVRGSNNNNVDDYLRVSSGKKSSMYDQDTAELLVKLPQGVTIVIGHDSLPGLKMSGQTFVQEDGNKLRWTYVHMYENEAAANSDEANKAYKSLEEDMTNARKIFNERGETPPFNDFKLEREGKFVKWSMLVDVKYAIALLFYG